MLPVKMCTRRCSACYDGFYPLDNNISSKINEVSGNYFYGIFMTKFIC